MNQIFLFPSSVRRDPAIDAWMEEHSGELGAIARHWFNVMRERGDDIRELLHDGHPTACVGEAAFVYLKAFTAHVNVGFFRGAELADPSGLLEGTGNYMRHVKLRPAYSEVTDFMFDFMEPRFEAPDSDELALGQIVIFSEQNV